MTDINAWIVENPMSIHTPIALCLSVFMLWWLWLVYRLGFGFAALKIRRRRFLFLGLVGTATTWGLYASSIFETTPIHWL